jgi:hypothetical protein
MKRSLDRTFLLYKPLFSETTFNLYQSYIHCCYRTFQGAGTSAGLRGDYLDVRSQWGEQWNPAWSRGFTRPNYGSDSEDVQVLYFALLAQLGAEIGATGMPNGLRRKRLASWARRVSERHTASANAIAVYDSDRTVMQSPQRSAEDVQSSPEGGARTNPQP